VITMNDLSLEVKAVETHEKAVSYYRATEQFAYKFFMEVKKIRDERYFEGLGFSNFESYCNENFNLTSNFINQKIQIADAWGENSETRVSQLGHRKSLYLARMEEPEREEFIQSNPVDEMTTKQLQQAIKAQKELERQLEAERNKPARVVEKVIERKPHDYDRLKDEIRKKEDDLKKQKEYVDSLKEVYASAKKRIDNYEATEKRIEALTREESDLLQKIATVTDLSEFSFEIENLLKTKLAPIRYSKSLKRLDNQIARNNLESIVNNVAQWLDEMKGYLKKDYIEVDYESID